ncbi:MAG: VacB/RNase II family 3'-5' exoribonuclease [Deltaproteobacteria bacterium]|nr:VacB/RNase II family 3'-5' exoribonuclease [Deltaproteobacteria bacterium]
MAPVIRTGTISVNPRGFGFLALDNDRDGRSAFIAPPDLNPLLAGDQVRAEVTEAADGRLTATKLELLSRSRTTVFGTIVRHKGGQFLKVDREVSNTDWRLVVPETQLPRPADGAWVVAAVQGDHVVCERVLEAASDLAFEQVLARYQIRLDHPAALATRPEAHPTAESPRRDLRAIPTVTIDAASTRDIDDAIGATPADAEGAMRILISIADVSSAVAEGSPLDEEARTRATSVYLPDRVLPMFPAWLSEDEMSLVAGKDRRCLTVELRIDPEGEITSIDVYRSLIRSAARLTYDQVAAFLDRGEVDERTEPVKQMLSWCRTASSRLSVARARRGGVEFESDETHLVVDANTRRVTVVEPLRNTSAHALIERFMVAANEAVARWLQARGVPAPYRVHDEPEPDSVRQLETIARNFGFETGFGKRLTPLALGALQRQIADAPSAPAILSVLAGALGQARYTVHAAPHFGLGAPLYLHFTSPIRRYADLLVHRAVGRYLDGERPSDPFPAELEQLSVAIGLRARRAEKAERDCKRIAAARYMMSRIGETFEGNITGVRPFGLQVQLIGSLIVGTIPIDGLADGPYRVSEATREMVGPNRSYAMGMPVTVRVARVDEMLGRIELEVK